MLSDLKSFSIAKIQRVPKHTLAKLTAYSVSVQQKFRGYQNISGFLLFLEIVSVQQKFRGYQNNQMKILMMILVSVQQKFRGYQNIFVQKSFMLNVSVQQKFRGYQNESVLAPTRISGFSIAKIQRVPKRKRISTDTYFWFQYSKNLEGTKTEGALLSIL